MPDASCFLSWRVHLSLSPLVHATKLYPEKQT